MLLYLIWNVYLHGLSLVTNSTMNLCEEGRAHFVNINKLRSNVDFCYFKKLGKLQTFKTIPKKLVLFILKFSSALLCYVHQSGPLIL